MPELPEVQTVVTELNKKIVGRKIKRVAVNMGKIISIGPQTVSNIRDTSQKTVNEFVRLLEGRKFVSVKRRGKMLIFDVDGPLAMLVHLKMTGQFIFEDKAQAKRTGSKYQILNKATAPLVKLPTKHTHVIFYFTDGSTLYYNDLRQFGYLRLVKDSDIDKVKEFQDYGPEPLDKNFTFEVFADALKNRKKIPIKLALMDTKVVVGIGNIYSDEILYHARVLPQRTVDTIKPKELRAIFDQIKPVLEQAVKAKGSSVGDFIRTDGKWGSMGKYHFVYGRKNQPCKVCGTIIKSLKLGGRTTCFCPKEQK
ncbi:MAG TPA: DNA-formamidopyrimidine glycosylase [Patescibacteria group bacterium]|jgi:formamidopyrimidine-DNA glycosylase|nr:DNA-formamidopyrimidine glycosylase [Patescibacteria group bacterium]